MLNATDELSTRFQIRSTAAFELFVDIGIQATETVLFTYYANGFE